MEGYKKRFISEYYELSDRIEKLGRLIHQYRNSTISFELSCPIELLESQYISMMSYKYVLKQRAEIEGIEVED